MLPAEVMFCEEHTHSALSTCHLLQLTIPTLCLPRQALPPLKDSTPGTTP